MYNVDSSAQRHYGRIQLVTQSVSDASLCGQSIVGAQ